MSTDDFMKLKKVLAPSYSL